MAFFAVPSVRVAEGEWGPIGVPEELESLPYVPFSRTDKIGRLADFGNYTKGYRYTNYRASEENVDMQYKHDKEEDGTFQTVDSVRVPRKGAQRMRRAQQRTTRFDRPRRGGFGGGFGGAGGAGAGAGDDIAIKKQVRRPPASRYQRQQPRRQLRVLKTHKASVAIKEDWELLEQFDLPRLEKLATSVPAGEDLKWCGALRMYDDAVDKVSAKFPRPVVPASGVDFFVKPTDDEIIQGFAVEEVGNVFATETVLAHLAASPRSLYPWDLVITCVAGLIFIEARDEAAIRVQSVNETALAQPPTCENPDDPEPNSAEGLATEAFHVDQKLRQQVLKDTPVTEFDVPAADEDSEPTHVEVEPNPFATDPSRPPTNVAYRYRLYDIGSEEDPIKLVVRGTVNALRYKGKQPQVVAVRTFLEWDSKLPGHRDWKRSVDAQRGAVLADEISNNRFQVSKWVAECMFTGVDQIKVGFISREVNKDGSFKHTLLGMESKQPAIFARELALSASNVWGIVKWLVTLVKRHMADIAEVRAAARAEARAAAGGAAAAEGEEEEEEEDEGMKFVLLKQPNKAQITLYSVPVDSFEAKEDAEGEGDVTGWDAPEGGEDGEDGAAAGGGGAGTA